jgi:hypothetical protein
MSTSTHNLPPGSTREIARPYAPGALPPTDLESRAADIKARQRVDDEARYRELVFIYRGRALTDDETVEITGLAEKLGMNARAIEDHIRAIRAVESAQKILAEPDPDLPALEAAADQAYEKAKEEAAQTIADFFRCASLQQIEFATPMIRANCPWLHGGYVELPDRKCSELSRAAASAKSALEFAQNRKPDAENTVL